MEERAGRDLTRILLEFGEGTGDRSGAADELYQAAYDELRRLARGAMRLERKNHTLQPTALVHEAYLKLVDQTRSGWQSRAHFFGIAGHAMREILVDHARRHRAAKRGGGWLRVSMDENLADPESLSGEILALHAALDKLAAQDERAARVVELRVFAGLAAHEAAHVLGVAKRTVDEDWRIARMWLSRELGGTGEA